MSGARVSAFSSGALTAPNAVVLTILLGAGGVLSGCAALKPRFGTIDSFVVRDQYDASPQVADARVVRSDTVVSPSVSMPLQKGDSIETSSTTRVVITFGAGYEVTLDTSTTIFIENPSIFLRIGRAFIAFIKRVRAPADTLTTNTPEAVLHDAGTRYMVAVDPAGTVTLSVVEGTVRAESRTGGWAPVFYRALERGRFHQGSQEPLSPLPSGKLEGELQWVREVLRVTRIPVPSLDSLTEADARGVLARVGLRVLLVTHRVTGRAVPGRVVEQIPSAGDSVSPGSYISLVLEKEPGLVPHDTTAVDTTRREDMTTCTVPGITDRTEVEARRRLVAAGLIGQATRHAGDVDVVTSQAEKAGSRVPCGSVVHYEWGRIR
jgi:hypothetical protein